MIERCVELEDGLKPDMDEAWSDVVADDQERAIMYSTRLQDMQDLYEWNRAGLALGATFLNPEQAKAMADRTMEADALVASFHSRIEQIKRMRLKGLPAREEATDDAGTVEKP